MNLSSKGSRSSTKRKVAADKRAALMHHNIVSSNSHILQDELAQSTLKRSNSIKNQSIKNNELLAVDEVKVEKLYLSKDDQEVVESSSSAVSE